MVTHKILVLGFLVRVQMVQPLLRRISNIKMSICAAEIHIIELLQQNAIDIEVLTNATKKYNKLCEELDILNSYKTIFGID